MDWDALPFFPGNPQTRSNLGAGGREERLPAESCQALALQDATLGNFTEPWRIFRQTKQRMRFVVLTGEFTLWMK